MKLKCPNCGYIPVFETQRKCPECNCCIIDEDIPKPVFNVMEKVLKNKSFIPKDWSIPALIANEKEIEKIKANRTPRESAKQG